MKKRSTGPLNRLIGIKNSHTNLNQLFALVTEVMSEIADPAAATKRLLNQRRRVTDSDALRDYSEDLQACQTLIGTLMEGRRRIEELELKTLKDGMTGLFNQVALSYIAPFECSRATVRNPLSALYVDLNGLKSINDRFGHATGSEFIVQAARTLANNVRQSDWVFKIGGDEFVVLMPRTPLESALERAKEIAAAMTEVKICEAPATASFGLASTGRIRRWRSLIHAADKAMYKSKALSKINPSIQEVVIA